VGDRSSESMLDLCSQEGIAFIPWAPIQQTDDKAAVRVAAERLGVAPGDCLVFEDTAMGIESATAAGMASVKVPPPWERNGG